MSFPKDFAWGVATAAYQIEGAPEEDGKGPSIWDMFCRREGAIWQGQTGDVACDHYHRWREDVAIMKRIGLRAYRFSISWPRVMPAGAGAVNPAGLAFYDRLVDALLKAGVEPYVTLFHWDLPLALHHRGGWLNADSPRWFADYAAVVADRLSDRVRNWITFNEPQVFVRYGYEVGDHAPGQRHPRHELMRIVHHVLLAHGRGVQALRSHAKSPIRVGFAPAGTVYAPATSAPEDLSAALSMMWPTTDMHLGANTLWLDPVFKGAYPEEGLRVLGSDAPPIQSGDLAVISQPLDFFGTNIYQSYPIRAGKDGKPEVAPPPMGHAQTGMGWSITPEALYWGPKFCWERYHLPIIITENGTACMDWPALDGRVHDPQRIDFLTRYLLQLEKAMREGVDVRGYMHWTFTDNFEWARGVGPRLGIVYTDYPTQRRIPKDSAEWYRDLIRTNGRSLRPRKAAPPLVARK